jgi:O-antigen/teichoic acid export membrane protein
MKSNGNSRVKNTVRNSIVGLISYGAITVISLISRTVFIHELGIEYLGVSGLYSNVLAVLSLSDLGINTVMVYTLYKPVAANDEYRINSLIHYYRKLYLIVAAVLFSLGLACIPLLPYIIKETTLSHHELVLYYELILTNTVCSYIAITKPTLIRADQKVSIIQAVHAATSILMHVIQIMILKKYHNYTIYLCVPIFTTLLNNVILTAIADKKYPYLKKGSYGKVGNQLSNEIVGNLRATFLYKLGSTILNSTDYILISALLGTIMAGYYDNYYTVVYLINNIIMIIINSMSASIGNYYATKEASEKKQLFLVLVFGFTAVAGFVSACYLAIFNDFLSVWIGSEYLLDNSFLIALTFTQAVTIVYNSLWVTVESAGLFKSVRFVVFIAAVVNLGLSIFFGKLWGISGIIASTGIARIVTLSWYEPKILYEKVFHSPIIDYWKEKSKLIVAYLIPACFGLWLNSYETNNIIMIIVKVVACAMVVIFSFSIILRKSQEYEQLRAILNRYFRKKK